jgi:hypothetical protein
MKLNRVKIYTIVFLVILLLLMQGCRQKEEQTVLGEQDFELEADAEGTEEEAEIKVEVTGNRLAIRQTPGTSNKPEGDVVERVDSGQVLLLINNHDHTISRDGYVWWEVHNPTTGATGWTAARYLAELIN